jgi:UDP-N-acetylmuramate: L-alanyl-gamma-D-glutamyl-meso-diaminopimelate ligase
MNLFIAGICGTFMAGIAQLARSAGHEVSGCDSNVYPPMSTLLESEGIETMEGYLPEHLDVAYDQIIIGNALSRGNPLVETILDRKIPYQSGPQWLHDHFLLHRDVIAVAGTHGKTSTASMLAWILESNQYSPGFLIGGKPGNFDHSARPGDGEWFVIEADEYDTAFFDKRSKFVHYSPKVAILNNLEFDHADIFDNIDQIKKQFHHLIRIVPANGHIIANADDSNINDVLSMGQWSSISSFSVIDPDCQWYANPLTDDASEFEIFHNGISTGVVRWNCIGTHNMANALAAVVAAYVAGIEPENTCKAFSDFKATDRRLQLLFNSGKISLYEDFAHHPTAIKSTIEAVRQKYPQRLIIAVVEPRSNTMRGGFHGDSLEKSFNGADLAVIYQPDEQGLQSGILKTVPGSTCEILQHASVDEILATLELRIQPNSVIICMSNGSFDGIPRILQERLETMVVEDQTTNPLK